jgi:anti-sigma factor RsiW
LEGFDIAEEELIDAYVRGRLSLAERTLVEKGLRNSTQLVERLHFARLLADAADRAAEDEIALPREREEAVPLARAWRPFGLRWLPRPRLNLAFAACMLIILIGAAGLLAEWLKLRRESQQLASQQTALERQELALQKSVAEQRLATDQMTAELREKQQKIEAKEKQIDELTQALNQKPLASLATTATLFLLPTSRSGTETELKLAAGTAKIRLQLAVGSIDYHAFVAELRNSQEQEISHPKVGAPRSGKPVVITIPSKLLPPGAYSVQLSGILPDGTKESVGNYSFRITRK